jgi:hypothetical protein
MNEPRYACASPNNETRNSYAYCASELAVRNHNIHMCVSEQTEFYCCKEKAYNLTEGIYKSELGSKTGNKLKQIGRSQTI